MTPLTPAADYTNRAKRNTAGRLAGGLGRTNEFGLFVLLVIFTVIVWIFNHRFLAASNIQTLGRDIAFIGILGVGESFVILLGGIDLSVGSVYGLAGVLVALFSVQPNGGQLVTTFGWSIPVAVVVTLLICTGIGIIHGLFVSKLKMHGFLITLVTLGVARGLATAITTGYPISGVPDDLLPLAQGVVLGIPYPFIIMIIVAIIATVLIRFTYIGRQIFAVGGNAEAARLSGVPVDRRIILCYAISAACAGLVGIIGAAKLTSGLPDAGNGSELTAIAACVIGGISLYGGQGSIPGTVIGAMIIGALSNAMIILKVSPYWQQVVLGIVLLLAITFDVLRRRRQQSRV